MTRLLFIALTTALAVPALAQDAPECEDADAALASYEGLLTADELAFGVAWLQDQIDLRPDGVAPCDLVAGAHAEADALLAERDSAQTATSTAGPASVVGSAAASPDAAIHDVPAGRGEHRIELVFEAPSAGAYAARAVSAPAWLRLDGGQVEVEAGADRRVVLPFRLSSDAPVGEAGVVSVEVVGASGPVGMAAFSVRVEAPLEVALGTPFPNPARGAVTLPFELPAASEVTVEVYDVLGRSVARLDVGERAAGTHEAALDGRALAAGAYVVRLTAESENGREVRVRRLTVVR